MVHVQKFGHTPKVINSGTTAQTEKSLTNNNLSIYLYTLAVSPSLGGSRQHKRNKQEEEEEEALHLRHVPRVQVNPIKNSHKRPEQELLRQWPKGLWVMRLSVLPLQPMEKVSIHLWVKSLKYKVKNVTCDEKCLPSKPVGLHSSFWEVPILHAF